MGKEEEADRTLFIRNLDSKVTEELLFELFLQAGPLIRTKIPKDTEGKQKTFGFAVYKHEVSVPYAMELLNGTPLHGKNIQIQFQSGSSHNNNRGNLHNPRPEHTPNTHGHRAPVHFGSSQHMPGSFPPHENVQKQIMTNNLLGMFHMQQQQQLGSMNGSFSNLHHSSFDGHSSHGGSRHHDSGPYRQHPSQANSGRSSGRHSRDSHYQQSDRAGYRHHDDRGGNRHYDDWGSKRTYQDRWRRY